MKVDKKRIVVVIPVYKSILNANEKKSLQQCLNILSDYDIIFVIPETLSFDPFRLIPDHNTYGNRRVVRFEDKWFSSIECYSKLMMSKDFYHAFDKYDYMLLYQLDAYVFYDGLQEWASRGYDYVGAPWTLKEEKKFFQSMYCGKFRIIFSLMKFINRIFFGKKDYAIGNGGLSLRNIEHSIKALNALSFLVKRWMTHEDIFWGMAAPVLYPFFKVPNIHEAFNFSFEKEPKKFFYINGNKLPFGCHGWEKYDPDFWKQFIPPQLMPAKAG